MTTRQWMLATAALAGLAALPALAIAQGSSGSSMMPQTTQTGPQEGPLGGTPAARGGANAGSSTGQTIQGNNAGSPQGGAQDRQTPPNMRAQGQPEGPQSRSAASTDGTPGANPPSQGTANPTSAGNSTPSGTPPSASAARANATTGASGGPLAVDSGQLRNGRRASKVIGSAVYNENNESIGEVDDILIPPGGGAPVAVISVGGFLGIGAKLVAVPYERLQSAGGNNRWTLTGATKDSLGSLPTFTYENTAERKG